MIIRLSGLISGLKGKSNGSIFQSSPSGWLMRSNKNTNNSNSLNWTISKSVLAFVSYKWRTLSESERLAWNAAAPSWPTLNKFNEVRFPSGYELFVRLNKVLASLGQPYLLSPPSPLSLAVLSSPSFSLVSGVSASVSVNVGSALASTQVTVSISPPIYGSRYIKKPHLCFLGDIVGTSPGTFNAYSSIINKYGEFPAGCVFYCQLVVCDNTTGQQGVPLLIRSVST